MLCYRKTNLPPFFQPLSAKFISSILLSAMRLLTMETSIPWSSYWSARTSRWELIEAFHRQSSTKVTERGSRYQIHFTLVVFLRILRIQPTGSGISDTQRALEVGTGIITWRSLRQGHTPATFRTVVCFNRLLWPLSRANDLGIPALNRYDKVYIDANIQDLQKVLSAQTGRHHWKIFLTYMGRNRPCTYILHQ